MNDGFGITVEGLMDNESRDKETSERLDEDIPDSIRPVFEKLLCGFLISDEVEVGDIFHELEKHEFTFGKVFEKIGFKLDKVQSENKFIYSLLPTNQRISRISKNSDKSRQAVAVCLFAFLLEMKESSLSLTPPFVGESFTLSEIERWCNQRRDIVSILSSQDMKEKTRSFINVGLDRLVSIGCLKRAKAIQEDSVETQYTLCVPILRFWMSMKHHQHEMEAFLKLQDTNVQNGELNDASSSESTPDVPVLEDTGETDSNEDEEGNEKFHEEDDVEVML